MSGDERTWTVFPGRFGVWNMERVERWLSAQERAGWRLRVVRLFGYTFEKVAPSEVAYRLDVRPSKRQDRDEYFGLFRDAGWEQVGRRGRLQVFRKAVVDGQVPQIYTDPQSRIDMYLRLAGPPLVFTTAMAMRATERILTSFGEGRARSSDALDVVVLALFAFTITHVLLTVRRLKKARAS